MSPYVSVDQDQLSQDEISQLIAKTKGRRIPVITPESWHNETGKNDDDLCAFIHANCRIHPIRKFLTGEEQLGAFPKLLIINTPIGTSLFLVSVRPGASGKM